MALKRLHHVMFGVTDLDATDRFTSDWGLNTVSQTDARLVKRTSGGDAYCYIAEKSDKAEFRGIAFLVDGMDDLERAVSEHSATEVRALEDAGGGFGVTLTDPDGMRVDLVAGIREAEPAAAPPELVPNSPRQRQRFDEPQSPRKLGRPHVFRLGHVGLFVKELAPSLDWYTRVLGLLPSELMHSGDGVTNVGAFLRLNRGAEHVDHHAIALFGMGHSGYHHSSYELQDYQAQFLAHRWLESRGWDLNWGVGRHPGGSHVFDMWFAPDRFRFESFTDTDWLSANVPPHKTSIKEAQIDIWSADPPDRYFAP